MVDAGFFALFFVLAHALAPISGARTLVFQNSRHPEEQMQWRRNGDAWAMTLDGRPFGRFTRTADGVTHQFETGSPEQWTIAELVEPSDLSRRATRIRLSERFSRTVLVVTREGPVVRISDPSRQILRVPLVLRSTR